MTASGSPAGRPRTGNRSAERRGCIPGSAAGGREARAGVRSRARAWAGDRARCARRGRSPPVRSRQARPWPGPPSRAARSRKSGSVSWTAEPEGFPRVAGAGAGARDAVAVEDAAEEPSGERRRLTPRSPGAQSPPSQGVSRDHLASRFGGAAASGEGSRGSRTACRRLACATHDRAQGGRSARGERPRGRRSARGRGARAAHGRGAQAADGRRARAAHGPGGARSRATGAPAVAPGRPGCAQLETNPLVVRIAVQTCSMPHGAASSSDGGLEAAKVGL